MNDIRITARTYLFTWLALLILTLLTFLISLAHLGAPALPVALAIAGTKGTLIALFFMHLAEARSSIWITLFVALGLFATLLTLAGADVATRITTTQPLGPR